MLNIYEQIERNKKRSLFLMVFFIIFVVGTIYLFIEGTAGDYSLVGIGLILSGLASFGSYWWSDKIILGISGAKPASKKEFFNFYTVTENLCIAAQIPMPKLYVIKDSAPNAFATGRDPNHAVICVTTGLLEKLNRTELEGVIGHEISHIKNYDIRLMSIVSVLVGLIALLGDWFLRKSRNIKIREEQRRGGNFDGLIFIVALSMAILAPIISRLIQLAISRRREFFADASSAMLTKYPYGLISALVKISEDKEILEAANRATAHLYIVNPFKGKEFSSMIGNLFNTHPSVEERIKALKGLG